jgi:hypothetical protein
MALRNSTPLTFKPQGVSDSVDGTNSFPGSLQAAQNLIPANDTNNAWVPRPGAISRSNFAGFNTPGFISAALVVGNLVYGMISTARNAGKDEPFVFNLLTNTFLTVSGVTAANVPASPPTSGTWTPPILSVVGTRIVVTHTGFPGGSIKFGWFDISGFTSNSISVTSTAGSPNITSTSNMLQSGYQPGQTITNANIPAGTTIISIAANGLSAVLSANATGSGTAAATVVGGTPGTPLWGAGDTNINNLPSIPVSVTQFNGRAYYAVGNGVVFSDSLEACNVTNASQAITFANGLPTTALGGLPLSSPLTGGIIQAVIAFQGVSAMQQITGDQATANLAVNLLNVATGTLAPLSITPTNFGLAFVSPDGLRYIDYNARVSDPVGEAGQGITVPFIYSTTPSRICAASTADVLRISTLNGLQSMTQQQEWWFDITRKVWSGPHTFPASLIQPWQNSFIMAPIGVTGSLWQSDAVPGLTTSYVENGVQLNFLFQTTNMPDNGAMAENSMIETAVACAMPGGYNLTLTAADETNSPIATAMLSNIGAITVWGSFTWGSGLWQGSTGVLKQRRIPWPIPIVFKQASLSITGQSLSGVKLGNCYFKYETLGYLLESS